MYLQILMTSKTRAIHVCMCWSCCWSHARTPDHESVICWWTQ